MKGPFKSLKEAEAAAAPGEVIMVRDTRHGKSPAGAWAVMSDEEATRAYNNPFNPFDCVWKKVPVEEM